MPDYTEENSLRQSFPMDGAQGTVRWRMSYRRAQMLIALGIWAIKLYLGWAYPPEGYLWTA